MASRRRHDIKETMANRFEVDQRAALFGSRYSGGGAGRPDLAKATANQTLEDQNDGLIDDLEANVHSLKEISLGIGREASESNAILNGLTNVFDKTGSLLKSTQKKLRVMMDKKEGRSMLYLVAFVVGLFFVMYFLAKTGRSKAVNTTVYTQGDPND
jgi:hypothetical protein